jgi:uncharacterized delta-60 repeat protein
LARLGTNGHLDLSYRTSFPPDGQIQTLGVLSNGPVMIGGAFDRIESLFVPGFARLTPDGSLDPKFANVTKTDEFATSLVVGPDDKTTAAIQSSDPSVTANLARLLRLNTNGTLDVTFNPPQIVGDSSSAATVTAMVLDPAGRLVIAGSFSSVGGTPHHGLARFNPDGTLDTNFDAGAGFGNAVFQASATSNHPLVAGVGLQDDGGIVVGGSFGTVNNQIRLGVARFQADKGTPPDGGGPGGGSQPKISSPSRVANGPFSMLVSGQVGVTYRVEASTDLRSWTSVGTVTGAASPQPFTDASAATSALRFYRVAGP